MERKRAKAVSCAGMAVCAALWGLVHVIPLCLGQSLLIGTALPGFRISFFLVCAGLGCALVWGCLCCRDSEHRGSSRLVLALGILLGVLVLLGSGFLYLWCSSGTIYEFSSPDGEHSIVLVEDSFLQGGWVNLYRRTSPWFIQRCGQLTTDDGWRPIQHGTYALTWEANCVTLDIDTGGAGPDAITIPLT